MADAKLPALQFYPGDWRKAPDVQALDFYHRGIWFELLMLMHESDDRGRLTMNGRPMPDDAAARLLGLPVDAWVSARATLLDYGVASLDENGALISRRMVKDEDIRQKRKAAGSRGGKASSRQAKPEQTPSKPPSKPEALGTARDKGYPASARSKPEANAKQKATPSVSSSVSSSVSTEVLPPVPPVAGEEQTGPTGGREVCSDSLQGTTHRARPDQPTHPDLDRLWTGGCEDVVRRVWHHGADVVHLPDGKPVEMGLEKLLVNDLLHRTDDPDMTRWIVEDAPHVLGWDDQPRTLYWALRGQNFDAAFEAYLERHPPERDPTVGVVKLKRIPNEARTA